MEKKPPSQIREELGSFITNLLKLNAKQLLRKKLKKKKPLVMIDQPVVLVEDVAQDSPKAQQPILASARTSLLANKTRHNSPVDYQLAPKVEAIRKQPSKRNFNLINLKQIRKFCFYLRHWRECSDRKAKNWPRYKNRPTGRFNCTIRKKLQNIQIK